jgi:isorenieratene synthase
LSWLAQKIEKKLGGYRHSMNTVNEKLPMTAPVPKKVAVLGAGLAGLSAALTLARRGFAVTLFEKNTYLGGKIGAWPVRLSSGETQFVEHGFHAFFRHYHNLNAFLDSLGLRSNFRPIEDYAILGLKGQSFSFNGVAKTPLLNLLSMARTGVYRYRDVLFHPKLVGLLAMLRFDPDKTFQRFDQLSYQDWANKLGLPPSMRLMFNSFSRAFFATPDRMSTAELLKSFHSFFLSHDGGLIYDYPTQDYQSSFLAPLQKELEKFGVKILFGTPVDKIQKSSAGWHVLGKDYDNVVLAADVAASKRIVEASDGWPAEFLTQISSLKASQGYAVLRLWTDRKLDTTLPSFVITEHRDVLDSVTFYHQIEENSRLWAQKTGGGIYELHCYALPDHLTSEADIRNRFLEEFFCYFSELRGMKILDEHLQVRRDFTALHTGMYAGRPGVSSGVEGLYLAGDWVKLPRPALLMEAACTSGLLAANAILSKENLQEEALFSVPPKGLFASRKSPNRPKGL